MDLGIDQPTVFPFAAQLAVETTGLFAFLDCGRGARVRFVEHTVAPELLEFLFVVAKHRARGRVGRTDVPAGGRDEDGVAAVFEDQAETFLARLQGLFAPLERFEQSVEAAVELTNLVEVGDRKRVQRHALVGHAVDRSRGFLQRRKLTAHHPPGSAAGKQRQEQGRHPHALLHLADWRKGLSDGKRCGDVPASNRYALGRNQNIDG